MEAINDLVDDFKRALRFRDLQIIELLFYCQMANKRVAEVMNITEQTVGVIKHRSLKQIRDYVDRKRTAGGGRADTDIGADPADSLLTEIWEYHRFSCPKRSTIGAYLLRTLDNDWQKYVDFHLNVLGCRFCRANMEDLQAEPQNIAVSTRPHHGIHRRFPPPAAIAWKTRPLRIIAPEGIRTPDLRIRNPLLYPTELRAQGNRGEYLTGFSGVSQLRDEPGKSNNPADCHCVLMGRGVKKAR